MEKITFSKKEKEYIEEQFDDSLKKVARHYKKNYDTTMKFLYSENNFILLTYYYFVNSVKSSIPKILSSMASEFDSSKKSRGTKKIDLGVIEWKKKWWPVIVAEFKYCKSGGVDLSKLHKRFENDFKKIEEENCKKYFILIHNPNNSKNKNSCKETKKNQIETLKQYLKNKRYKNFHLFYITPQYYLRN